MFFEGLDNDHGRATGAAEVGAGSWVFVNGLSFWCVDTGIIAEEFTQPLQLFDANMVGEHSVVTDAMKAWR